MTAYTARALSTNKLQNIINQTTHGFVVGNVVIFDGANWVLSQASSLAECAGTSMVSFVLDADNFVVTQTGWVNNFDVSLTPLTLGTQYYVDPDNPGLLTLVPPVTTGDVILPCLIADTTSSGYFFGGSGNLIQPGTIMEWHTITTDTVLVPNNGYFVNAGSVLNLTLPASFVSGDKIEIAGINLSGGWKIIQRDVPSQSILIGQAGSTTAGSTGYIQSTNGHDSLDLIGVTPNTVFMSDNIEGNLAYN